MLSPPSRSPTVRESSIGFQSQKWFSITEITALADARALAAEASRVRRRVESLELWITVKQCEVGILACPYRIAVTRLPRLPDGVQRVVDIFHRAKEAG